MKFFCLIAVFVIFPLLGASSVPREEAQVIDKSGKVIYEKKRTKARKVITVITRPH